MKKRMISGLLAAVMMVAALAGCGSGNSSGESSGKTSGTESGNETGVTEVTFWTLTTKQGAVEPIAEAFNQENDKYKVTVSYYDTDGIKDACKVAASSKTLPDMWFNWGGSLGNFYQENGLTYDLTEYAKENGWSEKFLGSALDLCTFDGKVTGYPNSYSVVGIYYRKDIFNQYGLEIPTTFEEFEKVCGTLKENGITPISTAGLNGWHVMRFVELLIEYYAKSDLHDSMNTFDESYNNEAVIKAFDKYKEFCEKGYFPDGFVTANPDDTKMAVYSGNCAMDIQGQWNDGAIISDGQDMNDYGVFAFPSGGTNRMSAFAEMTEFNASITEEKLEACMTFFDYYFNEENTKQYADYYTLPMPVVGAKMPEGQPNVAALLKLSEANGTFTITDQAFPTEVADVLFTAQDSIANGQMTPKDGAASIQSAIEAYQSK